MPREPFYSDEPDLKTATESDSSYSIYLIRIGYWDGANVQEVLLTSAPIDLSVDVGGGAETWIGTGLLMNVSDITDSADMDASGVNIVFDGVNQTIIAILMGNQFRGQPIEIYKAWFDASDGAVLGSPALLFDGFQLDPYTVSETSTDEPNAVSVTTRATNRLTSLRNENVVLTNPTSHLNYLVRGGLSDTTANFWILVPEIDGLQQFWGESTEKKEKVFDPHEGYVYR